MWKISSPRLVWLASLFLFIILYVANTGRIQAFIVIGSSLLVLLVYAYTHSGKISFKFDVLVFYVLLFCGFCYLSALWAQNSSLSIKMGNTVLVIFVSFFVMYMIYNDSRSIRDLLLLIMWGNYCVLGYAIIRYGWSTIVYVLQNEDRLSNDFLNANTIGLCAAYAVVINAYFILYEGVKLSDLLIVPAVVMLAASGSRKALLVLIGGIFAVFILKNFDFKRILRSIFRIILVVAVLLFAFLVLSRLQMFEGIMGRMQDLITLLMGGGSRATSGWLRFQYIQLGWDIFKENPILGIGIDNARPITQSLYGYYHYLHNNFIELLACGGIVGFLLYYSPYIYILYTMIKYHSKRDNEWDICFILLVIRLIMDYGAVSYETRGTYVYLILFWLEACKLRKRKLSYATHISLVENKIGEQT